MIFGVGCCWVGVPAHTNFGILLTHQTLPLGPCSGNGVHCPLQVLLQHKQRRSPTLDCLQLHGHMASHVDMHFLVLPKGSCRQNAHGICMSTLFLQCPTLPHEYRVLSHRLHVTTTSALGRCPALCLDLVVEDTSVKSKAVGVLLDKNQALCIIHFHSISFQVAVELTHCWQQCEVLALGWNNCNGQNGLQMHTNKPTASGISSLSSRAVVAYQRAKEMKM